MFPKSLILAVALGIVGSGALGLFFYDLKSSNELVFVEGSSLSILTEKHDYKVGEPIDIRIVNSGSVSLTFSDTNSGLEISNLDTIVLFSTKFEKKSLDSHDEIVFSWNQIKNNGEPALEGLYRIIVKAYDPQNNLLEKTMTVNILK